MVFEALKKFLYFSSLEALSFSNKSGLENVDSESFWENQ